MARYFKGVSVAVIVSLCAIPFMRGGLADPGLSLFTPMSVFCYALLLTASIFFVAALPPNLCCERPVRRNEIYYGCCILMCCCMGNATLQFWRLQHFVPEEAEQEGKSQYISLEEAYLLTPFGLSTSFWMNYVNYFIYIIIIYMIDNNESYRNLALYWSGATLTSELVAVLACFTGSHSHLLECSEFMHIIYIGGSAWVIYKFVILLPRRIQARYSVSRFSRFDRAIVFCLIILNVYALIRGLSALNGNQPYLRYYVIEFEPFIIHPSRFGGIWSLYTAVYGIPFQSVVIASLLKHGNKWMINMSILYAASVLQGTFVYLSYPFYPSTDPEYLTPHFNNYVAVVAINLLYVFVTHLLMYRCLKDQGYFHRACGRENQSRPLSPPNSQTTLYPPRPGVTPAPTVQSLVAQPQKTDTVQSLNNSETPKSNTSSSLPISDPSISLNASMTSTA